MNQSVVVHMVNHKKIKAHIRCGHPNLCYRTCDSISFLLGAQSIDARKMMSDPNSEPNIDCCYLRWHSVFHSAQDIDYCAH
jgi:hypothetical protein